LAGVAYTAGGTIGGALIGSGISYVNGGDWVTGTDRGALVGSLVGAFPGAAAAGENLARTVGQNFVRLSDEGAQGAMNFMRMLRGQPLLAGTLVNGGEESGRWLAGRQSPRA
jgi:hypothetical protein